LYITGDEKILIPFLFSYFSAQYNPANAHRCIKLVFYELSAIISAIKTPFLIERHILMKKLTLALVGFCCGTYVYGAEPQLKQPQIGATLTQEDAQIVINACSNAQSIGNLLAKSDLSQEEQSWVSRHKKVLIGSAAIPLLLAAVYYLAHIECFDRIDDESGKVAMGSRGPLKTNLTCFLCKKWITANTTQKSITTLTLIVAALLLYDLAHGKDATTIRLWNKFFGKKQENNQAQKKADAQPTNVAAPVAV
jgi:hypothetical protein